VILLWLGGVSHSLPSEEARLHCQNITCGICDKKLVLVQTYLSRAYILPCQLLPINISNIFLYYLGDGQWVHQRAQDQEDAVTRHYRRKEENNITVENSIYPLPSQFT